MRYRRMRRYRRMPKDVSETRAKVLTAFKNLRKQGFVARANFSCCQSCAGYDLATKISNMPDEKRSKVKGVVFWHHQDEGSFKATGHLYLAYGVVDTQEHGKIGLPTEEVGNAVCDELLQQDAHIIWNGDGNQRIIVVE